MSKRPYDSNQWDPSSYSPTSEIPEKQARSTGTTQIPAGFTGLVIGVGGSEIKRIQDITGCRVQVMIPEGDTVIPYRTVKLFGTPDAIQAAQMHIQVLITNAQVAATATVTQPPPTVTPITVDQKITIEMPIPPDKCGAVIGKGGVTMRNLRAISNCYMTLIQDSNVADTTKPLRITGTQEEVQKAQDLVLAILENTPDGPPGLNMAAHIAATTTTVSITVPRSTVGALMGVNGSTIKKIAQESRVKVQFTPDSDPFSLERTLVIAGTQFRVDWAILAIRKIVQDAESGNETDEYFYLTVPANKVGLVIGRNGIVIKMINQESGARCELIKDYQSDNQNEKTFIIRGNGYQIEYAKHLIGQKVGDIPMGTPFFYRAPPQLQYPPAQFPQYPVQVQYPQPPPVLQYPPVQLQYPQQIQPQPSPQLQYPPHQQPILQYPNQQYPQVVQYPQETNYSNPEQMVPDSTTSPEPVTDPALFNLAKQLPNVAKFLEKHGLKFEVPRKHVEKRDAEKQTDFTQEWMDHYARQGDFEGMAKVRQHREYLKKNC